MAHTQQLDVQQVYAMCDKIARGLRENPEKLPEVLIGLARGGFDIVARVSRVLGVPRVIGLPVHKDEVGVRHLDPIVQLQRAHIEGKRVAGFDDTTISGQLFCELRDKVQSLGCASFRFRALVGVGDYMRAPELAVVRELPEVPDIFWQKGID